MGNWKQTTNPNSLEKAVKFQKTNEYKIWAKTGKLNLKNNLLMSAQRTNFNSLVVSFCDHKKCSSLDINKKKSKHNHKQFRKVRKSISNHKHLTSMASKTSSSYKPSLRIDEANGQNNNLSGDISNSGNRTSSKMLGIGNMAGASQTFNDRVDVGPPNSDSIKDENLLKGADNS